MDATPDLSPLLAPGRALRPAAPGIATALAGADPGAPYDRHARVYDRLIGARAYNRAVWGVRVEAYAAFAAEAVAAGRGPFLDGGCGTAVFTAAAYRAADRPLVLVDRSVGMLSRAAARLERAPAALVQADLFDLPFAPGSFETVASFGVLHVLDDPWPALAALRDQVAPGGRLYVSMLVADRGGVGRAYLSLLRRAGEVGTPRYAAELAEAAAGIVGGSARVTRIGSMAFLRASAGESVHAPA